MLHFLRSNCKEWENNLPPCPNLVSISEDSNNFPRDLTVIIELLLVFLIEIFYLSVFCYAVNKLPDNISSKGNT